MSQDDLNIDNISRSLFRVEVNQSLQALASNSSGATEPYTTYAYQFWADTTTNLLKIRNSTNDGWITLGSLLVGNVVKTSDTGSAVLPVGTTANRDGTPQSGYLRFNTTLNQFEGYNGTAWGAVGGVSDGDKGDITVSSSGGTWTIDNDAVTFAKMQNIATSRLLGRSTAGSGDVEELSVGEGLGFSAGVLTTTGLTKILQGTAVATTSGSAIDFTGIPSWAKEITVMFNGVSTNGTSDLITQIGDSGGIEATGYLGGTGETANTGSGTTLFTTGIGVSRGTTSATVRHGNVYLTNITGTTWTASVSTSRSDSTVAYSGGSSKTLSATLDRVRITTVNGTDTFDAGSINILVKG